MESVVTADDRRHRITFVNGIIVDPVSHAGSRDGDGPDAITVVGDSLGQWPPAGHAPTPVRSDDGCVVDADGLYICPGFIDLQINGGHGFDLVEDPSAMWNLGSLLPRYGVTGFLPTFISSSPEVYGQAMSALVHRPAGYRGAEPLGLHFEGPMLNPARPGAHPPAHLRAPDVEVIEGWSRKNGVVLVTLAPELEGAERIIDELLARGVAVSAGHSAATSDDGLVAMNHGVRLVTHLFNAMAPLHHRRPGLAGFAMATDGIDVGLIVDGVHVDRLMVAATWRAKGPDQVVLVTDAVAAMGLGPGEYRFGESVVGADEHQVQTIDGTLAGSILTMDGAVRNTMAYTGLGLSDVLAAATLNPAEAVGLETRGRLAPGAMADLVFIDQQFNIVMTICAGNLCHLADGHHDRFGPGLEDWVGTAFANSKEVS
jgi:N-acetylglucosamine-6-phosphate deacetylase